MSVDSETIIAALLHDVVEDSAVRLDTDAKEFGERLRLLVDGVTKLGQIQWTGDGDQATRERAVQAENLRKMFLAMIDDIGVVLIKLADRLHNMRTLDAHAAREADPDRAADDGDLCAAGEPARHLAIQIGTGRPRLSLPPAGGIRIDHARLEDRGRDQARRTSHG